MTSDACARAVDLLNHRIPGLDRVAARDEVEKMAALMRGACERLRATPLPKKLRQALRKVGKAASVVSRELKSDGLARVVALNVESLESASPAQWGKLASESVAAAARISVPRRGKSAPLENGFAVLAAANVARWAMPDQGRYVILAHEFSERRQGEVNAMLLREFGEREFAELAECFVELIEPEAKREVAASLDYQIKEFRKGALDLNQGHLVIDRGMTFRRASDRPKRNSAK